MRPAAIVCSLVASAVAIAGEPKAPEKNDSARSETERVLSALRGTWAVTEYGADGAPVAKGRETWRPGPGGRSLIEEYHSTDSHGADYAGFALGWWDDQAQGFRITWCDNRETHGCKILSEAAQWQGATWVVSDAEFKEIFSEITPNSFTQTIYSEAPEGMRADLKIEGKRISR